MYDNVASRCMLGLVASGAAFGTTSFFYPLLCKAKGQEFEEFRRHARLTAAALLCCRRGTRCIRPSGGRPGRSRARMCTRCEPLSKQYDTGDQQPAAGWQQWREGASIDL